MTGVMTSITMACQGQSYSFSLEKSQWVHSVSAESQDGLLLPHFVSFVSFLVTQMLGLWPERRELTLPVHR